MEIEKINIQKSKTSLNLKIKSINKVFIQYLCLSLFLILIVLFCIILMNAPQLKASNFLEIVLVTGVFGFLLYNFYDTYYWLANGFECLEFDKSKNELSFYRKGVLRFNSQKTTLDNLNTITLNDKESKLEFNFTRSRTGVALGYEGGILCINLNNDKKIEFGASLSLDTASDLKRELNDFLKEK